MNPQIVTEKSWSEISDGKVLDNLEILGANRIIPFYLTNNQNIFIPAVGIVIMVNNNNGEKQKMESNIERLNSFLRLKRNWNEYGAMPFSQNHINFVKDIISNLYPQPDIYPTGRESILIEYNKTNGEHLSFELSKNKKVRLLKELCDGTSVEKRINYKNIYKEVSAFYAN